MQKVDTFGILKKRKYLKREPIFFKHKMRNKNIKTQLRQTSKKQTNTLNKQTNRRRNNVYVYMSVCLYMGDNPNTHALYKKQTTQTED